MGRTVSSVTHTASLGFVSAASGSATGSPYGSAAQSMVMVRGSPWVPPDLASKRPSAVHGPTLTHHVPNGGGGGGRRGVNTTFAIDGTVLHVPSMPRLAPIHSSHNNPRSSLSGDADGGIADDRAAGGDLGDDDDDSILDVDARLLALTTPDRADPEAEEAKGSREEASQRSAGAISLTLGGSTSDLGGGGADSLGSSSSSSSSSESSGDSLVFSVGGGTPGRGQLPALHVSAPPSRGVGAKERGSESPPFRPAGPSSTLTYTGAGTHHGGSNSSNNQFLGLLAAGGGGGGRRHTAVPNGLPLRRLSAAEEKGLGFGSGHGTPGNNSYASSSAPPLPLSALVGGAYTGVTNTYTGSSRSSSRAPPAGLGFDGDESRGPATSSHPFAISGVVGSSSTFTYTGFANPNPSSPIVASPTTSAAVIADSFGASLLAPRGGGGTGTGGGVAIGYMALSPASSEANTNGKPLSNHRTADRAAAADERAGSPDSLTFSPPHSLPPTAGAMRGASIHADADGGEGSSLLDFSSPERAASLSLSLIGTDDDGSFHSSGPPPPSLPAPAGALAAQALSSQPIQSSGGGVADLVRIGVLPPARPHNGDAGGDAGASLQPLQVGKQPPTLASSVTAPVSRERRFSIPIDSVLMGPAGGTKVSGGGGAAKTVAELMDLADDDALLLDL